MQKKIIGFRDEYNRNIIFNYIFKIIGIIFGLLNTKFTLGYLGGTIYGLWVTIASVISWMNSGDLGIGNGLRNELAKAYGEGDTKKQGELITAAVHCLVKLSVIPMGIILFLCEVLFHTNILDDSIRIPMYITAAFFCLNLILSISQSIALSYQKSWLTTLSTCENQIFSIIAVFILTYSGIHANLAVFACINGICTTLPNLILIKILQKQGIKIFHTKAKVRINRAIQKSIMNHGFQFFVLQICAVILYSTDNLIINKLLNSEMVTKYSLITKVYDTGMNLYSILLIALWSAVTYHIAQNDYKWVKSKIKQLLGVWIFFACGVIVVSVFFNSIIEVWIGHNVNYYEPELVVLFGAYCIMTAFSSIFVNVLNGMGTIKLQLILAVLEAILNIPLSVFFAQYCGMGILGVKLATFLCAAVTAVVLPVQVIVIMVSQNHRVMVK